MTSNETGQFEVYIRSYPEPTIKLQVSVGGGFGTGWSADGSRLYYGSGRNIMEAKLATTPGLRVIGRDTAFRRVPPNSGSDISRDGSHLLISTQESTAYPLVVVPGWRAELRERLASNR